MNSSLLAETSSLLSWIFIAVLVVLIVVFFVISSRRNKKKQQEAEDLMNAVKPGNKVKTIGGICGIVVEVDPEENTFVLETGTEQSGKSYLKFDKQAIYQTDAVVEKPSNVKPEEEVKEGDVAVQDTEAQSQSPAQTEESSSSAEQEEAAEAEKTDK